MRILLTLENANEIAGSKQYVHTLASAWAEEHEVVVAVLLPNMGPMGDEIRKISGVEMFTVTELVRLREYGGAQPFDLGIISPAKCYLPVHDQCLKTIQVTHGIVEAEAPVQGVDFHVFISEESRDHWGIDGPIIRNPIDMTRYGKVRSPRRELQAVAHFSNYDDIVNLRIACKQMGIRFNRVKHAAYPEVIRLLTDADLIFAVGRSAYEAMSMGREVVFCDNRNYYDSDLSLGDGFANQCYRQARTHNCSGRWGQHEWTVEDFVKILDSYDPLIGQSNRQLILDYHDHHKIAAQLLEVAGL